MTPEDVDLAEYQALKSGEQNDRIKTRDNLVYATLIALGAVGAFTLQANNWHLLLAVPYPVLILGWLYLGNDDAVARLRIYFRDATRHRLAARLDVDAGRLLKWEAQPRARGWRMWTIGALVFNLALFIAPAAAALTTWASLHPYGDPARRAAPLLNVAFLVDVALTAAMLGVVIHNSRHRHPAVAATAPEPAP